MACVPLDGAFLRSLRGAVKLTRVVMALVLFLCFAASRAGGAYTALAAMETIITGLFFLLYLLQLDKKLSWFFWPLADVFNSVVAALFLLIVCLFAVVLKTNNGTRAGGVIGLVLLALCVIDAILVSKRISLTRPRGRNTAGTSAAEH